MHKELSLYLAGSKSTSILLRGMPGSPLLTEALKAAAEILKTTPDKLSGHPDYLYIDRGGENSLGVAVSESILTKASLKPSLADVLVIVVHEFDAMTEAAQNKLLKLLEDNCNVIIIGTVFRDKVIPTIRSRTRIIEYRPLSRDAFFAYIGKTDDDAEILYCLTNGCPGLIDEYDGAIPIFKGMVLDYLSQNPVYFFKRCNLVEEKDKNNFYTKYPMLVKQLFCLIGQLISETLQYGLGISNTLVSKKLSYSTEQLLSCYKVVNNAIWECEQSYYTNHNFYLSMTQIVESLI